MGQSPTVTTSDRSPRPLQAALEALANRLEGFRFWLPGPEHEGKEQERVELVRSIRRYLLPRLSDPQAPVVAVLVGPSGSGKSVLLNSLAGRLASEPGPLRPTTRAPVVLANPGHGGRYQRAFATAAGSGPVVTVESDDPLVGSLTIVDSPDFVSVYPDGRKAGEEVLAAADLCVFVASALRYADAAAWAFLDQVRSRGVPILFVMNRLPPQPERRQALLADYADLLAKRELLLAPDTSLIFGIDEQPIDPDSGSLPATAVASIRRELALIGDDALRHQVVRQSTEGAVAEVIERTETVAAMVEGDRAKVARLIEAAAGAYSRQAREAEEEIKEGRLIHLGERRRSEDVLREVGASISRRAGQAARIAAAAWNADPEGRALLGQHQALWRHGPDTPGDAQRTAEGWGLELANVLALRANLRSRRPRHRRQLARALTTAVLDRSQPRPRSLDARLGRDLAEELIDIGSAELAQGVVAVLEADEVRFRELAAHADLPRDLADQLRAEAARVSEAAGGFYGGPAA